MLWPIACLAAVAACAGCGRGLTEPLVEGAEAGQAPETKSPPIAGVVPLVGAVTGEARDAALGASAAEPALGVVDRGIFSDLDAKVQIDVRRDVAPAAITALIDRGRNLLVLYDRDWPVKVYPLGGASELAVGAHRIGLRPGDRAELAPLLDPARVRELAAGQAPPPGDDDRDGIPDPLDVLLGGYMLLDFPGGDVPRDMGVCTDVIVRALRNAGLDLQDEVQREIRRAPRAFPMVKRPNAHIDHRRVKTVLPYFERRWDRRRAALDDPEDPLRPGDVIFMDTFPGKPGPDHVGILSDRRGPSGMLLVINSWTDGFRTSEMDLLASVPVTHRFRYPSR